MRYVKPPLTFEQQANTLLARGLIGDKEYIVERLKNVNYYRLSGYLFPFRQPDDRYKPGTTFEQVWSRYTFDRRLRLIVMDAIERVEVSVRTQLIYALAHDSGAFGYAVSSALPNLDAQEYGRWIEEIRKEAGHSREEFVGHFFEKYGDYNACLPLWMVGEIMSFGCMLTMYRGAADHIKRAVASYYAIPDEVLTVLRYLLTVMAPQSKWRDRLFALLDEYPQIPRRSMGFPDNWEISPLWK